MCFFNYITVSVPIQNYSNMLIFLAFRGKVTIYYGHKFSPFKFFFSLIHFCLNLALEERSSTAYVQLIELCLWATLQQQCTYRTQFSYIFLFINFDHDMLFIFRVAQKEQDLPYQSQYLFLRFPAAVILFLSLQNHIERLHQSQEIILKDYTRFRKSY